MSEPIYNEHAEQSVIGAVIKDHKRLKDAGNLTPDHFYNPSYAHIWRVILDLKANLHPIDSLTVAEEAGSKISDASTVIQGLVDATPIPPNVAHYSKIVIDKAMRRDIQELGVQAIHAALSDTPIQDALTAIGGDLAALHSSRITKASKTLYEAVLERTEYYQALAEKTIPPGWETGFPTLDKVLSGGLRPGKLYFIGARPGIGKSSIAYQIMMTLGHAGKRCKFLSQEMQVGELADRAVANQCGVNYSRLVEGNLTDDDWHKIVGVTDNISGLWITLDDQSSLTLADIESKVESETDIDFIVLDYLQLCSKAKGSSAGNRNSEIEEISRGLKSLAMRKNIAVLALSQLGRDVEKRATNKPVMSDLRDSGSIEQDADGIFLMWLVIELEGGVKIIGLNVAKNRQGRNNVDIPLMFFGDTQKWMETEYDIYKKQDAPRYSRPNLD